MINAKKSRVLSAEQMKVLSQYKGKMRVVKWKCQEHLLLAKDEVAEKQTILIEASRAKRPLEILKEKELKRFI